MSRRDLLPLAVIFLAACSDAGGEVLNGGSPDAAGSPSLVIEGELAGGSDQTVTLERDGRYVGFTYEEVATTVAEAGRFRFQTTLQAPEVLHLSVEGRTGRDSLYVGNEVVRVRLTLDAERPAEVEGSRLHGAYHAFLEEYEKAYLEVAAVDERLEAARESSDEREVASLESVLDDALAKRKRVAWEQLEQRGDSTLGAYIGTCYLAFEMDVDELEPLLGALDPALAGTVYYDQLATRLHRLRQVTVGTEAPNISGPNPVGQTISLASLRGQVVLIDFWASWCGPCRQQNPELVALWEDLHGSGLEILGVALEFEREPWLAAIEADDLPWLNISDTTGFDMEAAQLFAIRSIPINVLVDREGRIAAKDVHGDELRREILNIL